MLCFDATVKVLRNCNEQRSINDYKFDVYKVRAGLVDVYAFFDEGLDLRPGDIVKSSQVYLTNYDKSPHPTELYMSLRMRILRYLKWVYLKAHV